MSRFRSLRASLVATTIGASSMLIAGCGGVHIPPRVEVRDVSSGTTYTTFEPWGKVEKGVGYAFTDIESGRKVTLTNYESRTLESGKSVPSDSAEAREFAAAKDRGHVK